MENYYGVPDTMTAHDLSELKLFLSGYFHEDWELDASEPDEVVSQFLSSNPSAIKIDQIVTQIYYYLGERKDDAAVERGLLEELGCYYLPSADGIGACDWLRHMIDLLRKK